MLLLDYIGSLMTCFPFRPGSLARSSVDVARALADSAVPSKVVGSNSKQPSTSFIKCDVAEPSRDRLCTLHAPFDRGEAPALLLDAWPRGWIDVTIALNLNFSTDCIQVATKSQSILLRQFRRRWEARDEAGPRGTVIGGIKLQSDR